ncbi:PLP-dependent aminotransferase family protein [Oerskovia sp. Sa1BUA8]|uniref:PLP-dependent aminotransferase family protein n=1 Tax=Oerskovia douganii TaxID=2762210 RepID=A0A9D5UB83_9CELL|nr:PLP-dependent aminotransferase family protein [Oerskovia douganii]MBE7700876.1 PLP-dependent aminotransferase family protein [Oerskovia douganii]
MTEEWSTSGWDLHLEPGSGAGAGRRAGLEAALRAAIRGGRLAAGSRVPSTRALARDLGLARGTVSAAYDQLVAEGFLQARAGAGTRVAPLPAVTTAAAQASRPRPVPALRLVPGSPDVTTFPVAAWSRATRLALAAAPTSTFGYGDPRGLQELRTVLADYLARTRGVVADPERIVVTSGYAQGLALLAQVLHGAGAHQVAMEDPGLGFHRTIVGRAGLEVLPLPVDRAGACTDLLGGARLADVRAAVVTPAHQYPTGATLAPDRRRALLDWARTTGGLVIEDDYDGEFRYDRHPVGAVQGMGPDEVAYVGSVSKTIGPGVRLGWMVVPERWLEPVVSAKTYADHRTGTVDQLTLAHLIASHGYDRHVRVVRARYRRRRDLLVARLAGLVESGAVEVSGISAGLHAVVSLRAPGAREADVTRRAAELGLEITGLGEHRHVPGEGEPGIVVGFGTPSEPGYPRALDVLVRALGDQGGR